MNEEIPVQEEPSDPTGDGIYSTCGQCFAIVADSTQHEAWHQSRGEVVSDANQ